MFQDIKEKILNMITHRLFILLLACICLFGVLISRLFVLQIVQGEEHLDNFTYKSVKNLDINSARGTIYDKDGKVLAYNKLANSITFESDSRFGELAKKNNTTENYEMNLAIYKTIEMLEQNGDQIINDLPIVIDSKGKFKFSIKGSRLERFKKDVFGITNKERDYTENEAKQMKFNAKEIFEYLRSGKGSTNKNYKKFDIDQSYSNEDTLKIIAIRYNMMMNRYTQYKPITIAFDVSNESVAQLKEDSDVYIGTNVVADSLRVYNNSKYFSHILGYTGVISEDELKSLNKGKKEDDEDAYDGLDVVGKIGIEKEMETYLQGQKGKQEVFVDNLGRIIDEKSRSNAVAGNDVYLTIDSKLQKFTYDTLERHLAGIILGRLAPGNDKGSSKNIKIPMNDVYFALIDNNIVDITILSNKNATSNEKGIYSKLLSKQNIVLSQMESYLKDSQTPVSALNDENKEYTKYIYKMLNENNILKTSLISGSDEKKKAWDNGTISLGEFLKYAVQNTWIDISDFDISNDYYDIDRIYEELIKYIINEIKVDTGFEKIMYKYMIKSGNLSGREVCLLLYDQKVLNSKKDKDYSPLMTGSLSSYEFMKRKIRKIEITPAQLALDPCSGSVVVTDPKNGKVLVLVTYPGYDNNKLANSIDSDYYAQLNEDNSKPMINRVLSQKTAPGSTYKMISTIAALEEGIIDTNTVIRCAGVFDKVSPPAKCWISPSGHGNVTVEKALEVSCNVFFYEVGYRLGKTGDKYDAALGLSKIKKYAEMFGFDKASGVELPESESRISNEDAIRTAIGQGTNAYTPSQISRYLTAVANGENLYDLSILGSVKTKNGKTIKKYKPKIDSKLQFSNTTWNAVHNGMFRVMNAPDSKHRELLDQYDFELSGKTGTAQEDTTRANHALFVSYAPSKDPEITVTTVVPFGYSSSNAVAISEDIYKYYFELTSADELDTKEAVAATNSNLRTD